MVLLNYFSNLDRQILLNAISAMCPRDAISVLQFELVSEKINFESKLLSNNNKFDRIYISFILSTDTDLIRNEHMVLKPTCALRGMQGFKNMRSLFTIVPKRITINKNGDVKFELHEIDGTPFKYDFVTDLSFDEYPVIKTYEYNNTLENEDDENGKNC